MLPLAIRCGISYKEFWHLTPKAIDICVKAYDEDVRFRQNLDDLNAWRIGVYVAKACFDGKNYPQKPMFQIEATSEPNGNNSEANELLAMAEWQAFAHALRKEGMAETIVR